MTNLTQQARRLSDRTMFLWDGEIVEIDRTEVDLLGIAEERADPRLRERGVRMSASAHAIETRRLNLWYGGFQALRDVSVEIKHGIITSLIGPSGCGKTTLLRCFNRVNERYGNVRTTGEIRVLGENIYDPAVSLVELRKAVGMVFQRPNPLPISVYENVVFGLRIHTPRAELGRSVLDEAVEKALTEVGPVEGPEGPPGREGDDAPPRAAAEALPRPAPPAEARGHPDGRAGLGPRRRRAPARSRS